MKIYVSLSDFKILLAVYKIFDKGVKEIKKDYIINESSVSRRVLNRNIKNNYLKENLLKDLKNV